MNVPHHDFFDTVDLDDAIERLNKDRKTMCNRVFEAIKYGIDHYLLNVYLFEIQLADGRNYTMRCPRSEWEYSLESTIEYFEELEEYEKCADIRKIIVELNSGNFDKSKYEEERKE